MAHNFQSSTLSLTLPISCQICLGKVRQPVICANYHVFCSVCMEMWLKKASRCPTCRVPITEENPCKEIIGGTNESDHSESPSVRKCLRKTRGELLLREYEEEIDGLVRENEELKTKNQSLESQLKTALDPCSMSTDVQTEDMKVDPSVLEEWVNKLRAATDVCDKIKEDMEKLKEANKTLRSQNVDLVQENMRLKAEVVSRSPQKFGRYTVAALEAKIQQYERDVDHLKRALERSDQYIEDLESRAQKRPEEPETSGSSTAKPDALTQQQKIHMMMRSLSDNERASICSNPEADARTFSRNHSLVFMPSAEDKEMAGQKKDSESSSDFLPTTPSSAFRSLTLRSPGIREKKVAFKPASYLRRLDFDEFPSPDKSSSTVNQFSSLEKFPKDLPSNSDTAPSQSAFWGGWQRSESKEPDPSKESSVSGASAAVSLSCDESDSLQMSSEASMDAAYLDKISELDSMMLEGESCSSRDSQLSLGSSSSSLPADLDRTLVADPQSRLSVPPSPSSKPVTPRKRDDKEAPPGPAEESVSGLTSGRERDVHVPKGQRAPSQTDELSFDLLFDSLEHTKAARSRSLSPASHGADQATPSSFSCSKPANIPRERHMVSIGQTTKRKSHSPFNMSSPTKVTKLM